MRPRYVTPPTSRAGTPNLQLNPDYGPPGGVDRVPSGSIADVASIAHPPNVSGACPVVAGPNARKTSYPPATVVGEWFECYVGAVKGDGAQ